MFVSIFLPPKIRATIKHAQARPGEWELKGRRLWCRRRKGKNLPGNERDEIKRNWNGGISNGADESISILQKVILDSV